MGKIVEALIREGEALEKIPEIMKRVPVNCAIILQFQDGHFHSVTPEPQPIKEALLDHFTEIVKGTRRIIRPDWATDGT